jgi:glycosyltransferase involved in cell wall biosynthesis
LQILAVGRLVEQKGFADLLQACHLLQQRQVPFHCGIIGDGHLAADLQKLIAHYGLGQAVSLRGTLPQSEVFQAYQQATVFCAPSIVAHDGNRDGIPNVILEAMSQGLPVVASEVSGIPEVVRPLQTGWLVPPQDPEALAAALQEIQQRPQEARRRTITAYELVRSQFDVRENTAALIQLLLQTSAGKPPKATSYMLDRREADELRV